MKKVSIDKSAEIPNHPINNMSEGIGNVFGNMMNGIMNNQISQSMYQNENNIIDVESKDVKDIKSEDSTTTAMTVDPNTNEICNKSEENFIEIVTATPFDASIIESHNKTVGTIYFLCCDIANHLFIIERNFILENEDDKLVFECLPFIEDESDFASKKIIRYTMCSHMDTYVSDFKFGVDDGFEKDPNTKVWFDGTNIISKETVKFKLSIDTFSCLAFIDSYIFEGINNDHDFTLATVCASKNLEVPAEFFLVDKIDSVISMAQAVVEVPRKGLQKLFKPKKIKYDTTIGVVFKVNKFISNSEKEVATLLTPFDLEKEFDSSKFRGKSITDIQNEYFGDADQYVSTLLINSIRLYGIDKEYMIIRGKNKDKRVKLFLLDSSMVEELKHLIDEF